MGVPTGDEIVKVIKLFTYMCIVSVITLLLSCSLIAYGCGVMTGKNIENSSSK